MGRSCASFTNILRRRSESKIWGRSFSVQADPAGLARSGKGPVSWPAGPRLSCLAERSNDNHFILLDSDRAGSSIGIFVGTNRDKGVRLSIALQIVAGFRLRTRA